ncbi:MAG: hypothetical protein L3J07_03225 [Candidatus Magasanikbacteria bacterium]|nr:hypothetical protein [Candidatus Magasanikbacteria bacterium]
MLFGIALSTYIFYSFIIFTTLYFFSRWISLLIRVETDSENISEPSLYLASFCGLFGAGAVILTVAYILFYGAKILIFTIILFLLYFTSSYFVKKIKKEF